MVVGTGFEPVKALASRFTVCPRWPLGYPTTRNEGRSYLEFDACQACQSKKIV
jgi:hypothetical protein